MPESPLMSVLMQESTPQLTDILLHNPGLSLGAAVLFALLVAGLLVWVSLKRPPDEAAEENTMAPPPASPPPLTPVPEVSVPDAPSLADIAQAPAEAPEPEVAPFNAPEISELAAAEAALDAALSVEMEASPEPVSPLPAPQAQAPVSHAPAPSPAVVTEPEATEPPPEQDNLAPKATSESSESSEPLTWTMPLESVAGSPDPRPGVSLEELELPPDVPVTEPEDFAPATLVEADTDASHLEEWAAGEEDTPSPAPLLPRDEVEAELVEEAPLPTPETPPPAPATEADKSVRQQARLQHRQRVITTKVQLIADQLMALKEGPLSQMQQNMKLLAHRFAPTAWSDCQDTLEKARYRYQEATQLVRLANQLNQESEWPQQRIEMNLERAQAKIQNIEALAAQLDQRHQSLIQHYREAKHTWNEQAQRYKSLRQEFGDNSPHEKHLQRINHELQRLKQYFDPDHLFTPQAFEDKQRTITHLFALLTSESVDPTQEESMVGTP